MSPGPRSPRERIVCPACKGTKKQKGPKVGDKKECQRCDGTGQRNGKPCSACDGTGDH